MFGPDGYLTPVGSEAEQIVRYDVSDRQSRSVCSKTHPATTASSSHAAAATTPTRSITRSGTSTPRACARSSTRESRRPNGLISSPDQSLLWVADSAGRFLYSFQIQADGALKYKQQYGHLHIGDEQLASGADGMAVDTEGRVYVATNVGVQVLDQLGRVHLILDKPERIKPSNVVFGGPDFDTLYVTCRDKVFKRKLKAKGVNPWQSPIEPPKPGL